MNSKMLPKKRYRVYAERVVLFEEKIILAESAPKAEALYEEMLDKGDVIKTGDGTNIFSEKV